MPTEDFYNDTQLEEIFSVPAIIRPGAFSKADLGKVLECMQDGRVLVDGVHRTADWVRVGTPNNGKGCKGKITTVNPAFQGTVILDNGVFLGNPGVSKVDLFRV